MSHQHFFSVFEILNVTHLIHTWLPSQRTRMNMYISIYKYKHFTDKTAGWPSSPRVFSLYLKIYIIYDW